MNIIGLALNRPTVVFAAVLMLLSFGIIALKTIPIQLTPDVRRPVLQITTSWPGAAPAEVEREISNRLERELTGIPGLAELSSQSQLGRSRIFLEFNVDQDMNRAFTLVSSRLSSVTDLPDEARNPRLRTSGSDDVPIARFAVTRLPGNDREIETYGDFIEDVVTDRIERVAGVSQVSASGGSRRELQVIIQPGQMARYGLTVPKVLQTLRAANYSVTAGPVDEGKRRYLVRMESETATVDQVHRVVLQTAQFADTSKFGAVTVGDIAAVKFGYKEPTSRRRFNGKPMIRMNVVRENKANVIQTMDGVRAALTELNDGPLKAQGLQAELFYDETIYINSAINLVHQNIYIGGTLAAIVLLIFLRSIRATLVVSLAIPISVIGTFVAMALIGRSINVISLAGIAFAVGMVVDAAIVVLENIFRHRQGGHAARDAALQGARQVGGAVLASALTTVVVFVPVLTLDLQAGQLFRDIAVAISVAVLFSLIVSMTVIPALSSFLLARGRFTGDGTIRIPGVDQFARWFVERTLWCIAAIIGHRGRSAAVVCLVVGTASVVTFTFLPKLDYLPDGNRNFVIGRIQFPPGYNLDSTYRIAEQIETAVKPLWASDGKKKTENGLPEISSFFFIAQRNYAFIGASSKELNRAGELVPILRESIFQEPGTRGIVNQSSIFNRRIGGARVINVDIAGEDLEEILGVALRADSLIREALPRREGTQVRPRPGLALESPELRVTPDLLRLAHAGMTARDLGQTIDVLNDGVKVSEINVGSKRMDLTLKGREAVTSKTQDVDNLPVVTGVGTIVPVSSLATVQLTSGPSEIRHLDRVRTVTLQVSPPKTMPLESVIDVINRNVVAPLEQEGLPDAVRIRLSGAADNLTKTWRAMQINLLVAVLVVYLLMAILFESLLYPLIIMLSVPLASAGGVAGLALLNLYVTQQLDMLTILGFVILVGIVVNNAILLVDQTLQHVRQDGMDTQQAILAASRNRMRPIFMSTLTSVFGLLPLVIFPGAGSELYRGLGSVVVGGLALSAVLTLIIIPPLLALLLPFTTQKTAMRAG